jgi:acetate kinase
LNILVLNCGSSSLKYQVIEICSEKILAKGICDRINLGDSFFIQKTFDNREIKKELKIKNHEQAIDLIIKYLLDKDYGVLNKIEEINAIGHRVLHGGSYFDKPVLIDDRVKIVIKDCFVLGPLHNPNNLAGIEACEKLFSSNIKQVAVFDTAFHQTMQRKVFSYALPYELCKKKSIRRYGFHGTSHEYIANRTCKILNNNNLKIISCHLGNGSSICAIEKLKCIDTTMGMTPIEGLPMGTRCGDIDPGILFFLAKKENMNLDEIDNILNKSSGMLGISGISSDFRDLENEAKKNNKRAKLALEIFCYRTAKYIGAYTVCLGGIDVIVFTAGVGENSTTTRKKICEYLDFAGVKINQEKNNLRGKEVMFSTDESTVKLLVIPTNEELMIARKTKMIINNLRK